MLGAGLDKKEENQGVLSYNHELFENMAGFVDAVFEMNLVDETVYILKDRLTQALNKRQISMDEFMAYIVEKCHPKYINQALSALSISHLRGLKENEVYEIKSLVGYTYHTLKCSATPAMNEYGDTEVVFVSLKDIQDYTELYAATDAKQEELDRYLTSVSCGIIQYTRDSKKIIYANDTALDILGYSSIAEMQNDDFDGVVHTVDPEDASKIKDIIKQINTEKNVVECEYRVRHKDGKELLCIGKIRMIDRENDEPIIQRSMIDITSMRKTTDLYRRVADTLSVANMGIWYFILDDGAPRFYVDDVTARLVGISKNASPEEAFNFWYSRLEPKYKIIVDEAVIKMREGKPAEVTYLYNHPTRGTIVVRCGGLKDKSYSENGMLIRGYHQDITEYNKDLIEKIEIANTVNQHFRCVGRIDFEKKTIKIVADVTGHFTKAINIDRPIDAVIEYVKGIVTEDSIEELERISDLDNVLAKLNKKKTYATNIEVKDAGKVTISIIPSFFSENGIAESGILLAENID